MKGFFNRLLRIHLDEKSYRYEEIPDSILAATLGGKGLGAHLLLAENPRGVSPLSPDNRFIIAVGPLTGTSMWSQSRFAVFAKSPATGGYGESYCGGSLAPKIKGCGVDVVILQGACDALSYVRVDENGVTFHDAAALRGAETFTAERAITEACGPGNGAMVIGPAGESGSRFACIKSDTWRSLGRGGLGAVLGSKRLKGIAFAGTRKAEIADEALLKQVIRSVAEKGKGSPITEMYQNRGTPNQVKVTNSQQCFPTRYWSSGHFEHWQNLSADYMQQHFEVKRHGCPNCFLHCTKLSRVREGRHAGLELEGPEYETIYALGGLNCIDSLEEVAFLNDLCDRLGLDTMSAGNVTAFAVEACRRGRSSFAIDYNQPDRAAELLRLVAHRQGAGELFANGVKAAAERLGLEDLAVHVKGLEPGGFEPRVLKGMGLSYATSARGACHLRGTFYKAELSGEIEKEQIAGKALLHIDYEDRAALFDSLILCRFFRDFIKWEELELIIRASTGMSLDKTGLEVLANRITQMTREYNRREGLGDSADTLPERFFREKTEEGFGMSRADLQLMVGEYNAIRSGREVGERGNPG
jgi:aldehyde:ferredoxin oxidoreductase